MTSCCGGNADALLRAKQVLAEANGDLPFTPALEVQMGIHEPDIVRMEFVGQNTGAIPYLGRPSGRTYYGANNVHDKYANVDPRDVDHLASLGVWRVVPGQPRPVVVREEIAATPTVAEPIQAGDERPMLDLAGDMADEEKVNRAAAELSKKTRGRTVNA